MADSADAAPPKFLPLRLLQAVALYWIALKVAGLFIGDPHADEAYYWQWGQHFALSYLDHAPLHAWLQGLVGALFGWSLFSLRFLSLVTALVTLYIIYLWSRRLMPENWRGLFWTTAALFYASPLMLFYTTIAIHDRMLVAFEIVSIHFFAWFFADRIEGRRERYRFLYLGALFLGLATLTKYNGALVGIGVALAMLVRADLRPLFKSPHVYLAAALSIAMQFPVIYWNLGQGFVSFQFHLGGMGSGGFDVTRLWDATAVRLGLETLLVLSPIAPIGMAIFLFRRAGGGFEGAVHSTGKWVFIAATVAMLGLLTLGRNVLFYWNIVAYAPFFALAPLFLRSRILQAIQLGYGLILGTVLMVHFTVFPVLSVMGIPQPGTGGLFGWSEIASRVRAAQEQYDAEFVAAPSWGVASRLGFALGSADVPTVAPGIDAYHFWMDPEAHAGQDAIVLAEPDDDHDNLPYLRQYFDTVELVDQFDITRWGRVMFPYRIFIARNYKPEPLGVTP